MTAACASSCGPSSDRSCHVVMPTRYQIHPVLLDILHDAGSMKSAEAVETVTQAFSDQLTEEDLARRQKNGKSSLWRNRVRWARQDLRIRGLIDGSERGVWKLTAQGAELAADGESHAPIEVDQSNNDQVVSPPLEVLPLPAELVSQELRAAATDSKHPDRLERAVADAMRLFGFEVEEIGGSGRTDVLAIAPLGPNRYSVVLDAKASSKGRVTEAQIDWLAINKHREQEHADCAVVVGADFASGQFQAHAEKFGVSLLKVDDLNEVIGLHAQRPLSLVDLRAVMSSVPVAGLALTVIREAARARERRANLITFLLEKIQRFNQEAPDAVMAKAEVMYGLVLASANSKIHGATIEEVRDTLHLLATVGILEWTTDEAFVSQTSTPGALQMLARLGHLGDDDHPNAAQITELNPAVETHKTAQ